MGALGSGAGADWWSSQAHPEHVALIHCADGVRWTGLMAAIYLVYTKEFPTAADASQHFRLCCATPASASFGRPFDGLYSQYLQHLVSSRSRRGLRMPAVVTVELIAIRLL